jgi:hypothetical protein
MFLFIYGTCFLVLTPGGVVVRGLGAVGEANNNLLDTRQEQFISPRRNLLRSLSLACLYHTSVFCFAW